MRSECHHHRVSHRCETPPPLLAQVYPMCGLDV
jgi:hypothetical protein